ncbi:hypothetical protein DFH08DRAFT_716690, partial [Mycena albidolilacea]
SSEYILIVPHPHSGLPSRKVSLDGSVSSITPSTLASTIDASRPWAPFRCEADYVFASSCVRWSKSEALIKEELHNYKMETLAGKSKIMFSTVADLKNSLQVARQSTVQFEQKTVTVSFDSQTLRFRNRYKVELDYRDPWKVIVDWVQDETLAPHSTWYSVCKYLYRGRGIIEDIFDEPCTGENWREVDVSFPDTLPSPKTTRYPSCYLPLHIWLNKGQVSTKVKMHPILMRGLWIDSSIRNASGNGGGALLGYIIMPINIDPVTYPHVACGAAKHQCKDLVYNKINSVILDSLHARSHYGATLQFGDGVVRTGHPGIMIESMDFQELSAWLAMRSAIATYPCPKCLVPKTQLASLEKWFERRTPDKIKAVLHKARAQYSKKDHKEVLKGSGLHNIEQILWDFRFSDPYKAASYDTLHWTDEGKFGAHLWEVVKSVLNQTGKSNEFNDWYITSGKPADT